MGQNDYIKGQKDGAVGKFEPRNSDVDHIHGQITGDGGRTLKENQDYRAGHANAKSQRD